MVNRIIVTAISLMCLLTPLRSQNLQRSVHSWHAIRKERIHRLLPDAMSRARAEAWIILCRENSNDPIAAHIGGENAGGTAAFLFFLNGSTVHSVAISPAGESTALQEIGLHDTVITIARGSTVWSAIVEQLRHFNPATIALNSSRRPIADGLSYTQRRELENALGEEWSRKFVSAEEIIIEWLSVKLPEEVEIMREAARVTDQLQREAYATVQPGITTDADVARFIKKRMKELGVEDAWAPDQNPSINSGPDRGHSHSTDKVIQAGDLIQMDFGIKVHGIWCTDLQRFAYVLKKGETTPPDEMLRRWKIAVEGHRKVLAALRPGIKGFEADKVQREWLNQNNSLPILWGTGHPVGYWAHDVGPALAGGTSTSTPFGDAIRPLRVNQVFAYDGFYCWPIVYAGEKTTKTISVEEMAVITEKGAEYLIPPQDHLILIQRK